MCNIACCCFMLGLYQEAYEYASKEMVGYNGNFPTPLAEQHKCPCCSYALRCPVQTGCGHRLCQDCYGDLQRKSGGTSQITCPIDGSTIMPDQVFSDKFARREVLNLQTYCMYRNSGCKWQGVLKDYESHCEKCTGKCQYNCGAEKIPRMLFQQHYENECRNAVHACSYAFAGCNFKGTKDERLAHLAKEAAEHLRLAARCCYELKTKLIELSRTCENEARHNGILEQMVSSRAKELEAVILQCKELCGVLNSLERNKVYETQLKRSEQRRSGPTIAEEMDKLWEKARPMEQNVAEVQRGSNVHASQMPLPGAASPLAASATSDSQTDERIEKLENQHALQDVQIAELNLKLQLLEATSYDGKMIWKIDNFEKKRQDAITGESTSLYSQPFYTSRFGYKMCAKIYLNGEGKGKKTHISLFFVVMKGEYDAFLKWPFPCKIALKLLAQDGNAHITEAFRPDSNLSSFRRPSSEMNIASGAPLFVSQLKLKYGPYIKDNCIFIQVIVDTSILGNSEHSL